MPVAPGSTPREEGAGLPLPPAGSASEARAAVIEPVERGGRIVSNIAVVLLPAELQRIVDSQHLAPEWFGTVIDNGGTVVARHPGDSHHVGRSATLDLRERKRANEEGRFDSVSLDGVEFTGYFSTTSHGWTDLTAMPRARFAGRVPQAVLQIMVGALVLFALAVAGAMGATRSIVEPVLALKTAALRMQAGLPVERRTTGIAECDDVAGALAEAAEVIQHSRSDLEKQVADAVARTQQAEQRISQSQRVEALGRLTGGVAHDFSNLLGVISNSAHLIRRHPAAAELQAPLAATLRAVEVGSQLTQHLLRLSGRRPVRPQTLHLGATLPQMHDLLRSAVGRRIEITVKVAHDTAPAHVDAGELEPAMINLTLNARDALPAGGELRVVARNADGTETEGLQALTGARRFDVVLSDVVMPGDMDGLGLAPHLQRERPALQVVLISGFNTATIPSEFVVLRKPCGEVQLIAALHAAITNRSIVR